MNCVFNVYFHLPICLNPFKKKRGINNPINKVTNLVTFYQKNEITNQTAFKELFELFF